MTCSTPGRDALKGDHLKVKRLGEFALALTALSYWIAASGTKPVVSLLASDMVRPGAILGLIISGQALLPLFFAIPIGRLSDRLGQRLTLISGGALMMFAGLLYLQASTPLLLFIGQTVSGLGQVAVWLAAQALSTSWQGTVEERRQAISRFTLFVAIGQSSAPLIATQLLERFGASSFFVFYMVLSALAMLAGWLFPAVLSPADSKPTDAARSSAGKAAWQLATEPGMQATLVCTFLMLSLSELQSSFVPVYMKEVGLNVAAIGWVLAAGSVASLVVRVATTHVLRRWGLKWSLLGAFALAIGGIAAVPAFRSVIPLMILSVLTSLGLGVNQPLTLILIAETAPPGQHGLGMGLRLSANRLAQMVNPVMFGFFTTWVGMGSAFVLNAGLLGAISYFVFRQLDRLSSTLERGNAA